MNINQKNAVMSFIMLLSMALMAQVNPNAKIKLGIEVLVKEQLALVKGKRVGLITNATGVSSQLKPTVDILNEHPDIQLVALFGPEHGVRGDVTAGGTIDNFKDEKTGLPVFSLYGKTRQPTAEMLKNIDVLIYDIQDIGSRGYTYIYTMALSMTAAAENDKDFIVLDRPNPLGGELVEGNILEPEFASFIGMYPIPYIYGLTVGELAQYFNQEFGINCRLTVVPMRGWERWMWWDDTGLEWIPTSPHIPHSLTALFCAGTGIIGELRDIDVGVGYTSPFELIGAPWINGEELAATLNALQLPGIYFRSLYYRPYYFYYKEQILQGVQLHVVNRRTYLPIKTQIHILAALKKLYPKQDFFNQSRSGMFDKAMGTDKVRKAIAAGKDAESIMTDWPAAAAAFKERSKPYYLYK
jgi:uncharacterized protein YbbC (DUF1343 family)